MADIGTVKLINDIYMGLSNNRYKNYRDIYIDHPMTDIGTIKLY